MRDVVQYAMNRFPGQFPGSVLGDEPPGSPGYGSGDISQAKGGRTILAIIRTLPALVILLCIAFATTGQPPAFAQELQTSPQPVAEAPSSPAQGAEPAQDGTVDAATKIAGWNRILDGIAQALDREGVTNGQLGEFSDEAVRISREAAALIATLQPRVEEVRKQIDQLGPPPEDGAPAESAAVADNRKALGETLAAVDDPVRQARLVVVRADQINAASLTKRRDRFLRQLTERTLSIIDPAFWRESAAGVPSSLRSLGLHVRESMSASVNRARQAPGAFMALLAQLAAGVLVVWYLRRTIHRRLDRVAARVAKAGISGWPASSHLSDFVRNGLLPALLLVFVARMLDNSNMLADRFDRLVGNGLVALAIAFAGFSLLRVFLRPARPEIRIADLSDYAARTVFLTTVGGLVVAGGLHTLNVAAILLLAPFEISLMLSALFALTCIVVTARVLLAISGDNPHDTPEDDSAVMLRWSYVRTLLWLAVVTGAGGLLFGFIGLAEFIGYQIIMAMAVIGVIWLMMTWIDEARQAVLGSPTGSSRSKPRLTKSGRQLAIVGFGGLRLAIIAIAIVAMLLPWGVRTADWLVLMNRAFFGFEVGDLTISFSSILMALILFITGAAVTRAIQRWISTQLLPTTKLDTGMRNSITTVLGYLGFVLAAVLAIGAAGLDLSNLAIVAGALSVGIGFGLQSIVNNFVSGLILLAERPIKAGDWVVTGGGEGMVRRISVRSTEIETFDQATVIVPNSTLISESLVNWTHRSKLGRVIVSVGVGYTSDPEQVHDILLKCAQEHPLILSHPEPKVFFLDFGADALIFDVRAWVADILDGFQTKSDLRYAIHKALRDSKIEIPFPQRDLHIKTGLEGLAPLLEARGKASSAMPKPAQSKSAKSDAQTPARRRRTRRKPGDGTGGEDE